MNLGKADRAALAARIDAASLRAWPALHEEHFDGWLLRDTRGFTKRANSVSAPDRSTQPLGEKIEFCRAWYAQRRLPCIFRLTDMQPDAQLDERLAARGFEHLDQTAVLYHLLEDLPEQPGAGQAEEADTWFDAQHRLSRTTGEAARLHRLLVEGCGLRHHYRSRRRGSTIVACALGIEDSPLFGVFDVVTDPAARRAGHARALMIELLHQARQSGASCLWLQVVADNTSARRLYESLQFELAYHYWYRRERT